MGATVIALSCGLVFGIGLVLALSPLLSPPPERSVWGPWKRLSEDVERARVPGLSAAGLVLLSLALCAVVAAVVFVVTGAWPVAVIMSVGVAFLPYAWVVSRVAGRAKTVRAAWPEVIDSMVSGVRAGTSLPQVLCDLADEGPAPVRFAFEAFSRDYSANGRFASALDRMKDEVRDPVADRIVEAQRVAQGRVREEVPRDVTRWLRRAGASALDSLGSTSESVARRLDLAGMNPDVSVFRLRQATAGISGLILTCLALTVRPASSLRASIIPLCACALVGTLIGVAGMDRALTVRANRRQRLIDAAVPDCAELLALAVAAGESIPAAIERVAGCAGGPLGAELGLTAGHIRNGMPSVRALAQLDERTESPALTRLTRTLTTAIERGSPLASVLHDQARDQRERSLAALMEEGGRKEIAMLVPVVFLILPVTVIFALYPGLIALDFTP